MEPITKAEVHARRQSIFQRAYWFVRAFSTAGWKYATGDDSNCPIVYDPEWLERPYLVRADGSLTHEAIVTNEGTFIDTDGNPLTFIHFG